MFGCLIPCNVPGNISDNLALGTLKFHIIAFKFEALLWITETYSALHNRFYFSQFYLPLSHGRGCNMEMQNRLWVCYKLAMLMMQNFFVERFLSLG